MMNLIVIRETPKSPKSLQYHGLIQARFFWTVRLLKYAFFVAIKATS